MRAKPFSRGRPKLPRLKLIHEDDRVVVISVPPGYTRALPNPRPRPGRQPDRPIDQLRQAAENAARPSGRGRVRLWNTHHWDPDTSGIVVFARDPETAKSVRASIGGGRGDLVLSVVVRGALEGDATHRTTLIRKDNRSVSLPPDAFTGALDDEERPLAREAVTHFRAVRYHADEDMTVLQVREETGVREQARAHLSEMGHTVVNDGLYGDSRPRGPVAIHATRVAFVHPGTQQTVRYSDAIPPFLKPDRLAGAKSRDDLKPEPGPRSAPVPEEKGWEHVAGWYGEYQSSERSDLFDQVILPGTMALLGNREGQRVLDVACGEGRLASALSVGGAGVLGIDASPSLIRRATERAEAMGGDAGPVPEFRELDAQSDASDAEGLGTFDAAACVMALMNIENPQRVFDLIASRLNERGAFVGVVLHPAFRQPGRTAWQWDDDGVQRRTVEGYLSEHRHDIVMNPGEVSGGADAVTTSTVNRPIMSLLNACAGAGLLIDRVEEWTSSRTSEPGPRAEAENRARDEIPMFLAWRAIKA